LKRDQIPVIELGIHFKSQFQDLCSNKKLQILYLLKCKACLHN
jgi:hypothetical protein